MKPGPKKKPTALRILEGNPSKRPINEFEPACDLPAVKPEIIIANRVASQEWDRLMAAMPPQLYTAMDAGVLTIYALSWSVLDECEKMLASNGLVIATQKGLVTNPALRAWKAATESIIKCADRLGLHPGARVSLKIPERNAQPSHFQGLLGRDGTGTYKN